MNLIRSSKTCFIRYIPSNREIFFNTLDPVGGYTTSNKCTWEPTDFYIAPKLEIEDCCINFRDKSLSSIAARFLEKSSEEDEFRIDSSKESVLETHFFNTIRNDFGIYEFSNYLLAFYINKKQTTKLIELINQGKWSELRFTIFFKESSLIRSLQLVEENNYKGFSFFSKEFCISLCLAGKNPNASTEIAL